MEIFEAEGYSKSTLQKLNHSRMYLKAMTLSDIVEGYGDQFTAAYSMMKSSHANTKYVWPRIGQPKSSVIKLWKKTLKKTFGLRTGVLTYSLGHWISSTPSHWQWFYDPISFNLFERKEGKWRAWRRFTHAGEIGEFPYFIYGNDCLSTPRRIKRATIRQIIERKVQLTGWDETMLPQQQRSSDAYNTFPILKDQVVGSIQSLVFDILQGTAIAVSDGLFLKDSNIGTASWAIESNDINNRILGSLICTGPNEVQNPYRSELFGIMGTLLHMYRLCQKYNIQTGKVTLYCDGKSAIKQAQRSKEIYNNKQQFNVLISISKLKEKLPLQIEFHHI